MKSRIFASLFIFIFILPIQLFSQKVNFLITNEMNWIFLKVDNRMAILVEGVPSSEIIIKTSQGERLKVDSLGRFVLNPKSSRIDIKAYQFSKKDSVLLFERAFQVKALPRATAFLKKLGNCEMEIGEFHSQIGLTAEVINYDINLRVPIKKFTIIILNDSGLVYLKDCEGSKFEEEMKVDLRRLLKGGERVFFTNIEIEPYYHFDKWINSIEVKIKNKQE